MISQLFIKNFKAFEDISISLEKDNIIIGENDSGKSTILQALDIFFNQEKIDKTFVRNSNEDVIIGIFINNEYYSKTYSPSTFKLTNTTDNINDLNDIKYIYIPVGAYNPQKLITELSIAKTLENTPNDLKAQLKTIAQESINSVIESIDPDLIVINGENSQPVGEENTNYEGALKFKVSTNGIPIEARGSGFQKNLMYSLLIGNTYNNVILGIDEIENSFSINNCSVLINTLQEKMMQTIFTTHSKQVLSAVNVDNIYPLLNGNNKTLSELLSSLDKTNNQTFLLIEGKFDLPWYRKAINLLGKQNDYLILPAGGHGSIDSLKEELENRGKQCIVIKDGDTNETQCILKECVELYTPYDVLNNLFNLNLTSTPTTKDDFFTKIAVERNPKSVKKIISQNVNDFLTVDNDFVNEVKELLEEND